MSGFIQKFNDIHNRQKELDEEKAQFKKEFESYIKDKTIPLSQRWKIFIDADAKLKNHTWYIPFDKGPELSSAIYNFRNHPENYGRGKTINTVEMFEECYKDGKFYPYEYDEDDDFDEDDDWFGVPEKEYTEEELNKSRLFAFYEEILQANIGSFGYDW